MFDALFAFVGPMGSAAALFALVLPLFVLAAVDTARLARPQIASHWAALARGLGSLRLSPACIASVSATDDSPGRHAPLRFRALVRRIRSGRAGGNRATGA